MKCIFGIDLGGTQIKIGKFIDGKLVLKYAIDTDVSDNGKNIINDICVTIEKNLNSDTLIGIGIDVPGPVKDGWVLGAQNIGWKSVNVKEEISNRFPNVLVEVLNDANAALYGEYYCGGAKGYKNVVMMTLGTGLGGGIIIDGKVYEGANGSSGEIGHICIDKNGRDCTCGLKGCVEQYTSAVGILRTANEMRKSCGKETMLNKENLTCKDVFDFAKLGDEFALEVIEDVTDKLAIGAAAVCNTLNPDLMLVGGGVSKAGEFLLERLEKKFKKYAFYSVRDTKFALAKLGNDAGIFGSFYSVWCKVDESSNL